VVRGKPGKEHLKKFTNTENESILRIHNLETKTEGVRHKCQKFRKFPNLLDVKPGGIFTNH
jgi:hypothetical protein